MYTKTQPYVTPCPPVGFYTVIGLLPLQYIRILDTVHLAISQCTDRADPHCALYLDGMPKLGSPVMINSYNPSEMAPPSRYFEIFGTPVPIF